MKCDFVLFFVLWAFETKTSAPIPVEMSKYVYEMKRKKTWIWIRTALTFWFLFRFVSSSMYCWRCTNCILKPIVVFCFDSTKKKWSQQSGTGVKVTSFFYWKNCFAILFFWFGRALLTVFFFFSLCHSSLYCHFLLKLIFICFVFRWGFLSWLFCLHFTHF